jgi:hypothetical protein
MSKRALSLLFGFIFVSLLLFTAFASSQQPVWQWTGLTERPNNWWTAATMLDAYYGFVTFYMWVLYKEARTFPRIAWLVAILLLGNMAMSAYVLRQLWRLRPGESIGDLLAGRNA